MSQAGPQESFSSEQRKVLATILVPAFMSLLSVSIINVTLPAIRDALGAGTSGLQWVVSGYALMFGVLLVPAGRAGDVWGRGRLFVAGLATFGVGALLSGLAPNILMLNLARLVMGIGSGLLNPQVTGMIQQYFRGVLRGRAFGAFGGIVGVSVAVGPLLGGALVALLGEGLGWRWSFLINVPIAVVGIVAAKLLLPESAWRPAGEEPVAAKPGAAGVAAPAKSGAPTGTTVKAKARRRVDFDPVGMVLLALATTLVMVPFMEAGVFGPLVWILLVVGVALVVVWVRWEIGYRARGREPMVDLELFRTSSFATGSLLIAVYFFGSTGVWLMLAQYLQTGLGHSALFTGLVGLPAALAGAVSAPIAGRYVVGVGRPLVLWGLGVVAVGLLLSAAVVLLRPQGVSEWWLAVTLAILGLGQGMVISPNQTLTLSEVPLKYAGSAGGVLQTGQRIATSIGIAVITTVAFSVAASRGWGLALAMGFGAVTLTTLIAMGLGFVDLALSRRSSGAAAD